MGDQGRWLFRFAKKIAQMKPDRYASPYQRISNGPIEIAIGSMLG